MNFKKLAVTGAAAVTMFGAAVVPAFADNLFVDFENPPYSTGIINNVDGWSSFGAAGSGCALYDHKVDSSLGTVGFGLQSLRMSNAVTSGCFSDQTFSKSLVDEAGESTAVNNGFSGGVRQNYFEAEWEFASTRPLEYQPGLSIVASPDRGDGARMSWIQMADNASGLDINFYDYQASVNNFVLTNIASGLDRSTVHKIKVSMNFVDGPANDIVKVYVDGVLVHTGTSWEDYFRDVEGNQTRPVDSVLFRTAGANALATLNNGFLIDNLSLNSQTLVTPLSKDQCKKDGWKAFNNPTFKNQGQCVSYIEANPNAGKAL